jgi:UPF0042 nucleotide-binding protein
VKKIRVILISGLSGSGKTMAIKALEDVGYYCVDNLPILLLPKFIELCEQSEGKIAKVAVVEDIRGAASYHIFQHIYGLINNDNNVEVTDDTDREIDFLKDSRRIIQDLKSEGFQIEILFLEASDTTLMRRFSETRRQHPLAVGRSIKDAIQLERKRLQFIRDIADQVIDTSTMSVHQLKEKVQEYVREGSYSNRMTVTLLSFGYSFGIPFEADIILDVRFLPNPYFVKELRGFKGDHPKVSEYVMQWQETKELLRHLENLFHFLLPLYQREMKTHLTIAVGCTGGRHRSVVIANQLEEIFRDELTKMGLFLSVQHRDVEKG